MDLTCKLHILQDLRQAQNARKENELKFCTLKEASTAEIVEKKSRFIANSCHIESKEEAEEKINLIKKKYYDAKHNCFAFSIVDKDGNLLEKSSDDGEPSGTAGAPILAVENITDTFPIQLDFIGNSDCFMLTVRGESMIEAGIMNGDYILVKKQNTAENGEIVVALIDDEATVKTFYKEKDHIRLQPENSTMDPIIVPNCEILGKVAGVFRKL